VYARADLDASALPPVYDLSVDDALELDALDRDDSPTLDESSPDILYNTMGRHGDCCETRAILGKWEMCSFFKQVLRAPFSLSGVG
jgi:hypothetical protein